MESVDIIRLAREAGAVFPADGSWHKFEEEGSLERFAALVAAHEREACAKVCEERKINPAEWMIDKFYNHAVEHCAAAIRSRT